MPLSPLRILVVDDNRSAADALSRVLRKQGDDVSAVYDGQSAIDRLRSDPPDVILTDLKMEPVDGLDVLRAARRQRPPVEVIVFTAYGAVDIAVTAMQYGARDFLTKPITVAQVAARLEDLRPELPEEEEDYDVSGEIIEDDPSVIREVPTPAAPEAFEFVAKAESSQRLLEHLQRAAEAPSPVWIEGEIGSGRGHAAAALHHYRDEGSPLTVLDIGRHQPWPSKGTVLLPNVDQLDDDLQLQLVRDLQQLPAGVRLITTASPNGRRLISEGQLRADLYYALAVLVIQCPPLRQRVEDIPALLDFAMTTFSKKYDRARPELAPEQLERLQRHQWPGNVRELFNVAERAVVMGPSALEGDIIEAAPAGMPKLEPGFSLANYLESTERQILVEALRKADGDRNAAGRLLGVERNTLRYKLNKYGLLSN